MSINLKRRGALRPVYYSPVLVPTGLTTAGSPPPPPAQPDIVVDPGGAPPRDPRAMPSHGSRHIRTDPQRWGVPICRRAAAVAATAGGPAASGMMPVMSMSTYRHGLDKRRQDGDDGSVLLGLRGGQAEPAMGVGSVALYSRYRPVGAVARSTSAPQNGAWLCPRVQVTIPKKPPPNTAQNRGIPARWRAPSCASLPPSGTAQCPGACWTPQHTSHALRLARRAVSSSDTRFHHQGGITSTCRDDRNGDAAAAHIRVTIPASDPPPRPRPPSTTTTTP